MQKKCRLVTETQHVPNNDKTEIKCLSLAKILYHEAPRGIYKNSKNNKSLSIIEKHDVRLFFFFF